jgi:carboxylesterase
MPQFPWLDPNPFFLPAGPAGCLLIHGFTGSPPEMRPLGEYLAERGVAVDCLLLPGHGTTPHDLARTTWQDWYECVDQSYRRLTPHYSEVFVAGFSLGALLGAHLAVHHRLSGLILLSPAFWLRDRKMALLPLLRHVIRFAGKDNDPQHSDLAAPEAFKRFWSYDVHPTAAAYQLLLLQRLSRSDLPHIQAPTLVIYAVRDSALAADSGPMTCARLGADDREELVLLKSGHGLVVDSECELVFQRVYDWIVAHRLRREST